MTGDAVSVSVRRNIVPVDDNFLDYREWRPGSRSEPEPPVPGSHLRRAGRRLVLVLRLGRLIGRALILRIGRRGQEADAGKQRRGEQMLAEVELHKNVPL